MTVYELIFALNPLCVSLIHRRPPWLWVKYFLSHVVYIVVWAAKTWGVCNTRLRRTLKGLNILELPILAWFFFLLFFYSMLWVFWLLLAEVRNLTSNSAGVGCTFSCSYKFRKYWIRTRAHSFVASGRVCFTKVEPFSVTGRFKAFPAPLWFGKYLALTFETFITETLVPLGSALLIIGLIWACGVHTHRTEIRVCLI